MNHRTPEAFDRMLDDLPVGQPPIEGLVAAGRTARHRRQRTIVAGVVAATALVVGGVAFSSAALTSGDEGPPVAAPSGQLVDLPTNQWRPGQLALEARISGTLGLDENDCVVLYHPSGGARTYASWPAGYTATVEADGVHLFDADDTEVARQGDEVEMGGGYGPAPRDPQPCLPTGQGEVASIQSTVTVISSPSPDDLPGATPPATAPISGRAPDRSELVGTWRPLNLLGADVRRTRELNGNRTVISFAEGPTGLVWTSYEGCNWTNGTARLTESGALTTRSRSTTTRGCIANTALLQIANTEVIEGADTVRLQGATLRFYASDGRLLGEYERTTPGL